MLSGRPNRAASGAGARGTMWTMLDASLGGHMEVQLQFGPALWPVEVDPGEMELAIVNLCVNARDAMAGRGVLRITADNVLVPNETGTLGEFVRISVADDGAGMSPEVRARVFEPFFTTKDVSKGSGLGLPQVYGFTQQSGGQVTVDSAPGIGTTVTLLLPRSHRQPVATPGHGEQPTSPAGEGIRTGADICCSSKTTRKFRR